MGTFRGVFSVTALTGDAFTHNAPQYQYTLFGSPSPPPYSKDGTVQFDLSGNCFFLDGSGTPVSRAGLPSGFTMTSPLTLKCPTNGPPESIGGPISFHAPSTNQVNVTWGTYSNSFDDVLAEVSDIPFTDPIDFAGSLLLELISTVGSFGDNFAYVVDSLEVSGSYTAVAFSWTITTPDSPVPKGAKITIHKDPTDVDQPNLNDITGIQIAWDDKEMLVPDWDIIWITEDIFIFYLPYGFDDFEGNIDLTALVESTEFSGSVPLGSLTILFENGSGVYQLTPGKTNDTLYNPDRDGSTTDKAFPSPYGKTGFVGG